MNSRKILFTFLYVFFYVYVNQNSIKLIQLIQLKSLFIWTCISPMTLVFT